MNLLTKQRLKDLGNELRVAKGKEHLGTLGRPCLHCYIRKDNQQRPIVQRMELCSVLCGSLDGREVCGRKDTCICTVSPFAVHLKRSQKY